MFYILAWCKSFHSLRVKSSVYFDAKTRMYWIVLLLRCFIFRCEKPFISRPLSNIYIADVSEGGPWYCLFYFYCKVPMHSITLPLVLRGLVSGCMRLTNTISFALPLTSKRYWGLRRNVPVFCTQPPALDNEGCGNERFLTNLIDLSTSFLFYTA